MEGLGAGAVVLLGAPREVLTPSDLFAEALGLSRPVKERMRSLIEHRVGRPWWAFDVRHLAPGAERGPRSSSTTGTMPRSRGSTPSR
jgi:hypothetical protein